MNYDNSFGTCNGMETQGHVLTPFNTNIEIFPYICKHEMSSSASVYNIQTKQKDIDIEIHRHFVKCMFCTKKHCKH